MGCEYVNLSVTTFAAKAVYSQGLAPGRLISTPPPVTNGEREETCGADRSGRDPARLFHDREAHAGLVAMLFGDRAPGVLGFLAGAERALHLRRTFHQLVEIHRT